MEPYIGQIQPFGFNFPPRGWAFCDGQLLAISSNTALFSLLGTTFGGDGRTTFGLPDLRGRSIVGAGHGPGLDSITWGERGGNYLETLNVQNMPNHNHTATATGTMNTYFAPPTGFANSNQPAGRYLGAPASPTNIYTDQTPNGSMNAGAVSVDVTIGNNGGGQPFNIRNPFLGIYVSIALVGLFPPRN